jgi:Tol biopolymer transport system component
VADGGVGSTRFTFDAAEDRFSVWSPDGKRVAFASNRKGSYDLYVKPADGSGPEQLLLASPEAKRPCSWSPDGRFLLYYSRFSGPQNNGQLMLLPLADRGKPYAFLNTPFNKQQGAFSPDGRWVAYQSNESGRDEIYVRPFPGRVEFGRFPRAAARPRAGGRTERKFTTWRQWAG